MLLCDSLRVPAPTCDNMRRKYAFQFGCPGSSEVLPSLRPDLQAGAFDDSPQLRVDVVESKLADWIERDPEMVLLAASKLGWTLIPPEGAKLISEAALAG